MKTFTLGKPGISCRDGKINVGEAGRGRHQVSIPVPGNAEYTGRVERPDYVVVDATTGAEINRRSDADWAERAVVGGKYAHGGQAARLVTEPHWTATLVSVAVPGELPGEILVVVPDLSGFRGSSSISKMEGAVEVARGYCAQGDAGRMGGGAEYLLRVANGGSFTVSRSGRRLEWETGTYTNVNGTLVFRDTAKVAEVDAALAAFGTAPAIAPEIAAANLEREAALQARDAAAAMAAEAVKRGVESIRAETEALRRETWELEAKASEVRELAVAKAAKVKAAAELGNGFYGAFAKLGL